MIEKEVPCWKHFYSMSFRTLVMMLCVSVSAWSENARKPGDPLIELFSTYSIPAPITPNTKGRESLRGRVCRALGWLRHPKAASKIAADWIVRDFSDRSPKEHKNLQDRFAGIARKNPPLFVHSFYGKILAQDKRLIGLTCAQLQRWAGTHLVGKDFPFPACHERDRRAWFLSLLSSQDFILSRLKAYGVTDVPTGALKSMFQNAVAIGDFLGALAVGLSAREQFSDVLVLTEPFGVPAGPYACDHAIALASDLPLISTTFYYWYDFPTSPNQKSATATKWESVFSLMPPSTSGIHYENSAWYRKEWSDVAASGINTILPVYRGGPYGRFLYSDRGIVAMVQGLWALQSAQTPRIGLLLDGFTLGSRGNAKGEHIDLSTPRGALWLAAAVRNYYSLIPEPLRANVEGKILVGLKSLTQARSISVFGMERFRAEHHKVFGSEPYVIFPTEEVVTHVLRGNPPSVQNATNRLINGVPTVDVILGMLSSEAVSRKLGRTSLDYAQYFHKYVCTYSRLIGDHIGDWWMAKTKDTKESCMRALFQVCYHNNLERLRSRLLGTPPQYTWTDPIAEEWEKELVAHLTDYYASDRFFDEKRGSRSELINALSVALLGRCPTAEETIKMASMFKTWDRRTAISYLMSDRHALRRLASSWHVDYLMTSPVTVSAEISWEGHVCSVTPGIPTIILGRNNRLLAKIMAKEPVITERKPGAVYTDRWEFVLKREQFPPIVHLESWNGYHDGTAISSTLEYGSRYLDLTRDYTKRYVRRFRERASQGSAERGISSVPAKKKK